MRRLCILILTVLLVVIGAAAAIIAQQAAPASTGSGEAVQAAAQEADALAAQKSLVLDSIAKGDMVTADAACRALLDNPTPQALHDLVEEAKAVNKLVEVRRLYQSMIVARPSDPQVIWLKTGLAIASVHLGDGNTAEAALQSIIASHGSDDRVVEALNHVAWAYRKLSQYDEALKIYQRAVETWPKGDRAGFAQHGIVICQIGLGDLAAADKALDVLIQNFSTDADASKLILWAGFGYDATGQKEKAQEVYELLVQEYTDTAEAVSAQLRLALAALAAEDPNRMGQTVQTFLTRFAPTQEKAVNLRDLADNLFWKSRDYINRPSRRPDVLGSIHGSMQAIADNTLATWPKSDWALWAERDLATVAIQQGDDAVAETIFATIMGDYTTHPQVADTIEIIAEEYYRKGYRESREELSKLAGLPGPMTIYLSRAIEKWALITEQMSGSRPAAPTACLWLARAYCDLGDYGTAERYCTTLQERWPDSELAWQGQFLVVEIAKRMMRTGTPEKEAEAKMEGAFVGLLEKYPNSPGATIARKWLAERGVSPQGGEQ